MQLSFVSVSVRRTVPPYGIRRVQVLSSCSVLFVMVEPHAARGNTLEGMMLQSPAGWGERAGRWDSQATVYVLHDQLLGAELPPYKLPLDQVSQAVEAEGAAEAAAEAGAEAGAGTGWEGMETGHCR